MSYAKLDNKIASESKKLKENIKENTSRLDLLESKLDDLSKILVKICKKHPQILKGHEDDS
jgi:hypothetical protein